MSLKIKKSVIYNEKFVNIHSNVPTILFLNQLLGNVCLSHKN